MTQKTVVLGLLRENGSKGVSAHTLNYRFGITRSAAIIYELREEGMDIETIDEGQGRLARYVLRGQPQTSAAPHLDEALPLPPPKPLSLPCGCVRSPDGRRWMEVCDYHADAGIRMASPEVAW